MTDDGGIHMLDAAANPGASALLLCTTISGSRDEIARMPGAGETGHA